MTQSQLNVSEIFYSIQGEGPFSGRPAIFVRFSGCNLRCKWAGSYCDTPYASWEPETNFITVDQIVRDIRATADQCKTIILTGGEPTLQNNFAELCTRLAADEYELHLETNGLGPIPDTIAWIICSPKLADSTPVGTPFENQHEQLRQQLHEDIQGDQPRLFLKLVITPKSDWSEIERLVTRTGIPRQRVFLMPEGCTREEVQSNSAWVAAKALELGYHFSHRLHILLWGGVRGT